jgi:hypothetical protein
MTMCTNVSLRTFLCARVYACEMWKKRSLAHLNHPSPNREKPPKNASREKSACSPGRSSRRLKVASFGHRRASSQFATENSHLRNLVEPGPDPRIEGLRDPAGCAASERPGRSLLRFAHRSSSDPTCRRAHL